MKKVFISHPYIENIKLNLNRVDFICKNYINKDKLAISPLHLFRFYEGETPELRKNILDTCFRLIDICDMIYIFTYSDELSQGQEQELNYCLEKGWKVGKEIVVFRGLKSLRR